MQDRRDHIRRQQSSPEAFGEVLRALAEVSGISVAAGECCEAYWA